MENCEVSSTRINEPRRLYFLLIVVRVVRASSFLIRLSGIRRSSSPINERRRERKRRVDATEKPIAPARSIVSEHHLPFPLTPTAGRAALILLVRALSSALYRQSRIRRTAFDLTREPHGTASPPLPNNFDEPGICCRAVIKYNKIRSTCFQLFVTTYLKLNKIDKGPFRRCPSKCSHIILGRQFRRFFFFFLIESIQFVVSCRFPTLSNNLCN